MSVNESITNFIATHAKERLHYIDEVMNDGECGSYYLFRFYSGKRNIFGFKKYLNIICYDNPENKKFVYNIDIEIPGLFRNHCVSIYNNNVDYEKIMKILHDCYFTDNYNKECRIWKNIGKILK